MPFGQQSWLLLETALAQKKTHDDLQDAFVHSLDSNRKLQQEIGAMHASATAPRERFRDQLLAISKNLLGPAATTDRNDREKEQAAEISLLHTQVVSLHSRMNRQTDTIERQQQELSRLHSAYATLHTLQQTLQDTSDAEIARLRSEEVVDAESGHEFGCI